MKQFKFVASLFLSFLLPVLCLGLLVDLPEELPLIQKGLIFVGSVIVSAGIPVVFNGKGILKHPAVLPVVALSALLVIMMLFIP